MNNYAPQCADLSQPLHLRTRRIANRRSPYEETPMPVTSAVTSAVKETRADLEMLQGAWLSVSGRHQAELLIAGNLFAVKFLNGKIYMGTLDLDAGERPKEMLMRIDEGPIRHKGKFALCIYELTGDTLRWCPTE